MPIFFTTIGCSKKGGDSSLQFTDPTKLIEKYYDLVRQYGKDTLSRIVHPDLMAKFTGRRFTDEAERLAEFVGTDMVVKNIELDKSRPPDKETGNQFIVAVITFENDVKNTLVLVKYGGRKNWIVKGSAGLTMPPKKES